MLCKQAELSKNCLVFLTHCDYVVVFYDTFYVGMSVHVTMEAVLLVTVSLPRRGTVSPCSDKPALCTTVMMQSWKKGHSLYSTVWSKWIFFFA